MKKRRPFNQRHPHLHILAVAVLVIMVWRGVWGLLDAYLFPNNLFLSYVTSLAIGLAVLYFNDFSLSELKS